MLVSLLMRLARETLYLFPLMAPFCTMVMMMVMIMTRLVTYGLVRLYDRLVVNLRLKMIKFPISTSLMTCLIALLVSTALLMKFWRLT